MYFLRFLRTYYFWAQQPPYIDYVDNENKLPSVCVIIPVKLITNKGPDIRQCWKTHLMTSYKGNIEYLFVVEDKMSPTIPILHDISTNLFPSLNIRTIIAGKCCTSSQKIHNMLAGIRECSPDTKYIQFLDINCEIYPSTIENNVKLMEVDHDNKHFIISGCPLDIPVVGANILSWILCQFRHQSVVTEFYNPYSGYIWGGHMFLRYRNIDIGTSLYHRLEHSYSDDMTVQNYVRENGHCTIVPYKNLFHNTIRENMNIYEVWNFLRRQCFTITYYQTFQEFLYHFSLYFILVLCHSTLCYIMFILPCYIMYNNNNILEVFYLFSSLLLIVYAEKYMIYEMCSKFSSFNIHIPFISYLFSMILLSPILLCAAIVTIFKSTLTWGNIKYARSNGSLAQISHLSEHDS